MDMAAYYREIEKENNRKMDVAVEYLLRTQTRFANILDVGAGLGLFLKRLADAGFTHLAGHEIPLDSPSPPSFPGNSYSDHDYSTIPSDHFDVVTLLDVAEHVPEPQLLFDACYRVLKPGGVVYFHTPVVSRSDRIMHFLQRLPVVSRIGRIWQRGRTSIYHLENYTPQALHHLLQKAGFVDTHIKQCNELSWPVSSYVRGYLIRPTGLPEWLTPPLTFILSPLLKSSFFNANKAIVSSKKAD